MWARVTKLPCIEHRIPPWQTNFFSVIQTSEPTTWCYLDSTFLGSSWLKSETNILFFNLIYFHFHLLFQNKINLLASVEMPLSDTGVSHRLSTCNFCKCSLIICNPVSPNWVAHRFKYLSAGNLMSCSAQADVTEVNAKLRNSKLPRAPPPSKRATSASVARTGRVNFFGPPFCCCKNNNHIRKLCSKWINLFQQLHQIIETSFSQNYQRITFIARLSQYDVTI